MAKKQKNDKKKEKGLDSAEQKKPKQRPEEKEFEVQVRILGFDVPGSKNVYTALTYIKGVSWAIANVACHKLKLDRKKKISELSKPEIQEIEAFLEKTDIPGYLMNRRTDRETGESIHLYSNDLDMKKEFDIKRLRKIKSYKGIRHAAKLPVRGQRTRANFRNKGQAVGVKRKAK
jgi:small subunit ribosomal protein S13